MKLFSKMVLIIGIFALVLLPQSIITMKNITRYSLINTIKSQTEYIFSLLNDSLFQMWGKLVRQPTYKQLIAIEKDIDNLGKYKEFDVYYPKDMQWKKTAKDYCKEYLYNNVSQWKRNIKNIIIMINTLFISSKREDAFALGKAIDGLGMSEAEDAKVKKLSTEEYQKIRQIIIKITKVAYKFSRKLEWPFLLSTIKIENDDDAHIIQTIKDAFIGPLLILIKIIVEIYYRENKRSFIYFSPFVDAVSDIERENDYLYSDVKCVIERMEWFLYYMKKQVKSHSVENKSFFSEMAKKEWIRWGSNIPEILKAISEQPEPPYLPFPNC